MKGVRRESLTKRVHTFHCYVCHKAFPNDFRMSYDQHLAVVKQHMTDEHPSTPKSWYDLYSNYREIEANQKKVIT